MKPSYWLAFILFVGSSLSGSVQAQVTTDGTTNTTVTPTDNGVRIDNGDRAGNNLFHSFDEFSVPDGGSANFNNAAEIENIFSRVTGGNISDINGAINANGGANLLLINPAGIVFGENASLNIGGSFFATSADTLLFESGEFSAVDPQAAPLLTINRPIGLNFGNNAGDIVNRASSNGLEAISGQNISLLGGNVSLEGGLLTAPAGTITLGGLNDIGEIGIDPSNNVIFTEKVAKSNVFLDRQAGVDVRGAKGGSIQVNANNLNITESSIFLAGIPINSGSANTQSGDINLNLNNLVASGNSEIRNETLGTGNAGNINITTGTLDFIEGSAIVASTFGRGNAGDVNINATGDVSFERDFGGINTNVGLQRNDTVIEDAVGNAGNISIEAESFSLTNGARLVSKTSGQGNSGNIDISVSENVFIDGEGFTPITVNDFTFVFASGIFTQATADSLGEAGDITVDAKNFRLDNKVIIATESFTVGNSGSIAINAEENIFLGSETLLLTTIQGTGEGQAGDISLTSRNLDMVNARIFADTNNKGNAGDIKVNVSKDLTMQDESKINSQLNPNAVGNAGNIEINVGDRSLIEDGTIISTSAESNAVGNAGNIDINAGSQTITDGIIIADSQARGSAGNINITAEESIILQSNPERSLSGIVTGLDRAINAETGVVESAGEGNAGNINLSANQINIDAGAFVISDIEGIATGGGEININTNNLRVENNAFISTFTITESNAGSIDVVGDTLILESGGKLITSTDGKGDAGTIDLSIADKIIVDNGKPPNIPKKQLEDPVLNELQNRTGLFVNATERATGNGGDIFLKGRSSLPTNNLRILNGAEVSADGASKGNAGNIFISAKSLELNNDASLVAKTFSENGGNINLAVDRTLTLSKNSLISAEADSIGNGGNINIDADFIVAFGNDGNGSDIVAKAAETGMGGNINISTDSILGLQERNATPFNNTNDLDASSEFGLDGEIAINNPDVDPTSGIIELPTVPIDAEAILAQDLCKVENENVAGGSSFIITGRGGLTPTSAESLSNINRVVEWTDLSDLEVSDRGRVAVQSPEKKTANNYRQSQGLMVANDGSLWLTADASSTIPQDSTVHPDCSS